MKQPASKGKAILKKINIDECEMIHVGIDTHKKTFHVAVWSQLRDKLLATWVTPARPQTLMAQLDPCREHVERIVYEAGPTGFSLARRFRENGWPMDVVSAAHTPEAPVEDDKCDRLDAKKLARFSTKNMLHPVYVPTQEEEEDRALWRCRHRIAKQQRRIKQQIKGFLLFHGIDEPAGLKDWSNASVQALGKLQLCPQLRFALDEMLIDLAHHRKRLASATARLRALARSERYCEKVEQLRQVPGVGLITALGFCLELPSPDRFATPRQVGRILALSPRVRSTGQTRRGAGRHRGGLVRVRSTLIEACWQWRRRDPMAAALYSRYRANTGEKKKAITALARKLAIILWRLATRAEPYEPGLLNPPESVCGGPKPGEAQAASG
jgi:transposase